MHLRDIIKYIACIQFRALINFLPYLVCSKFLVCLFKMMQWEHAPWAQWRLTGQESLFYWHILTFTDIVFLLWVFPVFLGLKTIVCTPRFSLVPPSADRDTLTQCILLHMCFFLSCLLSFKTLITLITQLFIVIILAKTGILTHKCAYLPIKGL